MILNDNSPEFPTVPPFGSPNPQAGESVCDLNLHVLTRRDWLVVEEPGDAGRRLGNQRDFHPDHLVVAEDQPVVVVLGQLEPGRGLDGQVGHRGRATEDVGRDTLDVPTVVHPEKIKIKSIWLL